MNAITSRSVAAAAVGLTRVRPSGAWGLQGFNFPPAAPAAAAARHAKVDHPGGERQRQQQNIDQSRSVHCKDTPLQQNGDRIHRPRHYQFKQRRKIFVHPCIANEEDVEIKRGWAEHIKRMTINHHQLNGVVSSCERHWSKDDAEFRPGYSLTPDEDRTRALAEEDAIYTVKRVRYWIAWKRCLPDHLCVRAELQSRMQHAAAFSTMEELHQFECECLAYLPEEERDAQIFDLQQMRRSAAWFLISRSFKHLCLALRMMRRLTWQLNLLWHLR